MATSTWLAASTTVQTKQNESAIYFNTVDTTFESTSLAPALI